MQMMHLLLYRLHCYQRLGLFQVKIIKQQQLQSIMRLRELAIKHKTALSNQLGSLLLEFNIRYSARTGGLRGAIESTLENGENAFPTEFRSSLSAA